MTPDPAKAALSAGAHAASGNPQTTRTTASTVPDAQTQLTMLATSRLTGKAATYGGARSTSRPPKMTFAPLRTWRELSKARVDRTTVRSCLSGVDCRHSRPRGHPKDCPHLRHSYSSRIGERVFHAMTTLRFYSNWCKDTPRGLREVHAYADPGGRGGVETEGFCL
jgi:hypothetical protein